MSAAIDMLAKKLTDRPDDAEGWSLLGRSYYAMQRFPEAVAAFEKAMKARKDDPDLLANYADALGMTQGRSLVGKPQELAQQALKINPHHPKALALAASAELEQKHVEASLGYWRRLQAEYPAGSEEARDVAGIMEDIRPGSSGATASAGPSAKVAESGGAASGGPGVSGTVEITSKFTGKADPNDTVFIYARSAEGPRMPLSIQRITVKDLPRKFSLDDSMGMAGGPKLSQAASVKIEARISKSGNAMPQPGDLTGEAGPVKPGARDVAVLIDHIVQ
jgi:cytochrome c-type biogenesis protein CcmH